MIYYYNDIKMDINVLFRNYQSDIDMNAANFVS